MVLFRFQLVKGSHWSQQVYHILTLFMTYKKEKGRDAKNGTPANKNNSYIGTGHSDMEF